MKRQLVRTRDNSTTLFVPELDEHYHSIHGALQESQHVFIQAGLREFIGKKEPINILEIGFGTGLNALLTSLVAEDESCAIRYFSLEKYPVESEEWQQMNFAQQLATPETGELLNSMHEVPWEAWNDISPNFQLYKHQIDFREFNADPQFDLVYFDAFAPSAQPNLWTINMFESMFRCLKECGLLVTYCVKGEVRRNMKAAGFEVEKIPGPPGKREMARAWKNKS